jgi:hypothetical protein
VCQTFFGGKMADINKNYYIRFSNQFIFYDDTNDGISEFWERVRKEEI